MKFSQRSSKPAPPSSKAKRAVVTGPGSAATTKTLFKTSGSMSFAAGSSSVSRSSRGPPPLVPLTSVAVSQQSGAGPTSCLSALLSGDGNSKRPQQEVGGASGGQGRKTGVAGGHVPGSGETGGRQKSPSIHALLASEHSSSVSSSSSESEAPDTTTTTAPPPPPPPPPLPDTPATAGAAEVAESKAKGVYTMCMSIYTIPFECTL